MTQIVRYVGNGLPISIAYAPGVWRPGDDRAVNDDTADRLLNRDGFEVATCETVKDDGDVCGRDRPCRYHDEVNDA